MRRSNGYLSRDPSHRPVPPHSLPLAPFCCSAKFLGQYEYIQMGLPLPLASFGVSSLRGARELAEPGLRAACAQHLAPSHGGPAADFKSAADGAGLGGGGTPLDAALEDLVVNKWSVDLCVADLLDQFDERIRDICSQHPPPPPPPPPPVAEASSAETAYHSTASAERRAGVGKPSSGGGGAVEPGGPYFGAPWSSETTGGGVDCKPLLDDEEASHGDGEPGPDLAVASACLGLTSPSLVLAYPADAEAHFAVRAQQAPLPPAFNI